MIWMSRHIPRYSTARGAIIGHHEVTEHVGDGHPRAALDDHQQHQGPEEDAQGGVNAFPEIYWNQPTYTGWFQLEYWLVVSTILESINIKFPKPTYTGWWLVYLPLWKIWKSVGTIIPNIKPGYGWANSPWKWLKIVGSFRDDSLQPTNHSSYITTWGHDQIHPKRNAIHITNNHMRNAHKYME